MPTALVPLAQGCEELEAVTIIDILRRGKVHVTTAGLESGTVTASRGVKLVPDTTLDDAVTHEWDLVVMPGGLPGADHLAADARLEKLLHKTANAGRHVAAICAAPKVLAKAGLLDGKNATAYPGCVDWDAHPKVKHTGRAVEVDGNVVTSRGPGTAMDFALTLVELLQGKATRDSVEQGLVR